MEVIINPQANEWKDAKPKHYGHNPRPKDSVRPSVNGLNGSVLIPQVDKKEDVVQSKPGKQAKRGEASQDMVLCCCAIKNYQTAQADGVARARWIHGPCYHLRRNHDAQGSCYVNTLPCAS
jgi:hypothetical protein